MASTDDKVTDCYIIECDMMNEENDPSADFKRALAEYKRRQTNESNTR